MRSHKLKRPLDTEVGSALLKHVSAEDCQLLLESDGLAVGMRLAVTCQDNHRVTGTVRWIVGMRAGFAFDHVIGHEVQAALESEHPLPTPVKLHAA